VVQAPVPGTLGPGGHADAVILSTGISYAIAIYPYMAELEDEFDVAVYVEFFVLEKGNLLIRENYAAAPHLLFMPEPRGGG